MLKLFSMSVYTSLQDPKPLAERTYGKSIHFAVHFLVPLAERRIIVRAMEILKSFNDRMDRYPY